MFIEVSLFIALGAMLCWGIGDFFIQKTVRRLGNIEALALIAIIGSVFLLPFILKEIHLLKSPQNLFLLLFLGIFSFFIAILNFEALKQGKLSVIDVILEIELPITVLLGIIFFREIISRQQIFMMLLIFTGILLIAKQPYKKKGSFTLEKGVLFGIFAALGLGVINFLTAASTKQISPIMAIWFPWLIIAIISLGLIAKRESLSKFVYNTKKYKLIILITGVIDTLAWVFYAFALKTNDLAITTAITESYPAIAILLGVMINKEKIRWYQYLGAAIAIMGSIALLFI